MIITSWASRVYEQKAALDAHEDNNRQTVKPIKK